MQSSKLKLLVIGIVGFGLLSMTIACSKDNLNEPIEINNTSESGVEFVDIPGDGEDIDSFQLGKTEVTNQQYVDYLNSAMIDGLITVVDEGTNVKMIYDNDGNQMVNILGYRVIKDHDRNGTYELWEMENPLNRSMIDYNSSSKTFSVVDPSKWIGLFILIQISSLMS